MKIGRDPKRAWSGGDPTITFGQFVNNGALCDSRTFQTFEAGYKLLGQTKAAAQMGRDELALLIGHEAVSLTPKLKTKDGLVNFLAKTIAYAKLHGMAPDRETSTKFLKAAEPQPLSKAQEQRRELAKLRAENEALRAENAQLKAEETPRRKGA